MHTERIRALADLIEQQPHTTEEAENGFNMSDYTHDCGTPCCIAGWAEINVSKDGRAPFDRGQEWLGLTIGQAEELFYVDSDLELEDITPSHAAAVLRHLADHGVVDWTVGVSV